jgi:hypothetical protein
VIPDIELPSMVDTATVGESTRDYGSALGPDPADAFPPSPGSMPSSIR